MCQASQMSEDILSEDIELTENVRQGGITKESTRRKQKEETGAHVLVLLRYSRAPVIIMLPNKGGLVSNYCITVVVTWFLWHKLHFELLYRLTPVEQTFEGR